MRAAQCDAERAGIQVPLRLRFQRVVQVRADPL
eukprot:SAG31_NODE_1445_length_8320_cov_3.454081_4_plen_33_part_00